MSPDPLSEREFELVNIIGAELASTQRDLSRQMDLSLGMINMLIRRMISKGYIRIKQLNKRKFEYILTPKGFSEKMRKSVKYTVKTMNSITTIKNCLRDVLKEPVKRGERNFTILGKSDFATLVEIVLRELCDHQCQVTHVNEFPPDNGRGTLLICREEDMIAQRMPATVACINLVEELARGQAFPRIMGEN